MFRLLKGASIGWSRARRVLWAVSPLFLLAGLLGTVASAYQLGALQPLKSALYEFRFRLSPRVPTGEIVLVEIDAKSIAAIGT